MMLLIVIGMDIFAKNCTNYLYKKQEHREIYQSEGYSPFLASMADLGFIRQLRYIILLMHEISFFFTKILFKI